MLGTRLSHGTLAIVGVNAGCSGGAEPVRRRPHAVWERGSGFPATSIAPAGQGQYFLVGEDLNEVPSELVVAKINSLGEELWRRRQELSPGWEVADSASTKDGGCIVLGCTGGWAKRETDGEVLWEVTRGNHHGDGNLPMLLLPGGKVIAGTGFWDNSIGGVAAYLLQIDSAGKVEWELRGSRQMGRVLDLQETEDHGVLVLCEDLLVKLPPD